MNSPPRDIWCPQRPQQTRKPRAPKRSAAGTLRETDDGAEAATAPVEDASAGAAPENGGGLTEYEVARQKQIEVNREVRDAIALCVYSLELEVLAPHRTHHSTTCVAAEAQGAGLA